MKSMIFKTSNSEAFFLSEHEFISKSPANAVFAALGASLAGADSLALLSLDELKELSDILFSLALSGVHGGLLIAVKLNGEAEEEGLADFAERAKLALLCPPVGEEAEYINKGFELSKKTQTAFLIRLRNKPVSAALNEFEPLRYRKRADRFVLEPENSAERAKALNDNRDKLAELLDESGMTHRIYNKAGGNLYSSSGRSLMCTGCPYRGVYYLLSKNWLRAFSDSGCLKLGSKPPLLALDVALYPGSSPSVLRGFLLAADTKMSRETVALIDLGGLKKGGMLGIEELASDGLNATVIVLDNITANFYFEKSFENIPCAEKSSFDSFDLENIEKDLKSKLETEGLKLIHCKGPCVLTNPYEGKLPFKINKNRCKGCKACGRLGCPAISPDRRPDIDTELCASCGLCEKVCQVDAITRETEE